MFCSHCGSKLPDGALFCPNCGTRVSVPVAPEPEPEVVSAPDIVEEAVVPVADTVEEVAGSVADAAEEAAASVVEAAEEIVEEAAAEPAVVENAVDDVEAALARLKAEMAASGELPAEVAAPAVEENPEPIVEAIAEAAEPVVEQAVEATLEAVEAAPEVIEAVPAPVEEAAEQIVEAAPEIVEPVAEPLPAVAPVIPVATPAEPAAYVEQDSAAQTTINTIYNEPTTISAPMASAEPAYVPPATQAYTPPAAQPQVSYAPPAPVAQPASTGYSYQPAAAAAPAAAAQPKKSSPVAKIAIAAVVLALLGVAIWAIFGRGGGNSGGGTPAVTPSYGGYELLDSKGNPTFFTIMEEDGEELVAVLEGEGFTWESSNKWWLSSDGNDAFYVSGNNDYEYSRSEISDLAANGEGDSCVFVAIVDDRDYDSGRDALEKLCNVEVLDTEWADEDYGAAVVAGPSGAVDLAYVDYNDEVGLYYICVFNEDAAQSGLVDEYIGSGTGSVADCWYELTGRTI